MPSFTDQKLYAIVRELAATSRDRAECYAKVAMWTQSRRVLGGVGALGDYCSEFGCRGFWIGVGGYGGDDGGMARAVGQDF